MCCIWSHPARFSCYTPYQYPSNSTHYQTLDVCVPMCAAEIIKRRVNGLHQITEISSADIIDTWEPKEEGLNRLEITRHVSVITITLSTQPLDTSHVGYQPPLDEELVKPVAVGEIPREGPRRRRGGRGGR